jgi:prepilin-type N-terminal cleavage/methylation domain-containing protein
MKMNKKGFTLIELMIVVAIIGILAAIAIPKFADLINKSKEGATKGALSTMRGALQVYYGDNEGAYPAGAAGTTPLDALILNAKYLAEIPVVKTPGTATPVADSNAVNLCVLAAGVGSAPATINGMPCIAEGGWGYVADNTTNGSGAVWGTVFVNVTQEDIKGLANDDITTSWTTF